MRKLASFIFVMILALPAWSAETKKSNIRYRQGKTIDFEALLIQGQLKRPEISVVTGDVGEDTDGLLRLRENFLDTMAMDAGEEVK